MHSLISRHKVVRRTVAGVALFTFIFTIVLEDAWAMIGEMKPSYTATVSSKAQPVDTGFDVKNFVLPSDLGQIESLWSPDDIGSERQKDEQLRQISSKSKRRDRQGTVIHIQDAHCNYAAQHTISKIIDYLSKKYGIDTVNLEGGKGSYDLSIFTKIEDKGVREKVADYFVREGLVNGAEYCASLNPDVTLWGIEETGLYVKNLNAYRETAGHKDDIDLYVRSLRAVLEALKERIYSEELSGFDGKYSAYKKKDIELRDYLEYLLSTASVKTMDIKAFPNLHLLYGSIKEESDIDLKKADIERDKLIEHFRMILSDVEMEELVLKTVEFAEERISPKAFYSYLAGKAYVINLDLGTFPELKKYIAYISSYDAIDKSELASEMDSLEDEIKKALCENTEQERLVLLSKNLTLMESFFSINLTRHDFEYYRRNKGSFAVSEYAGFIKEQSLLYNLSMDLPQDIHDLDQYSEKMTGFYEYSFKRDEAFVRNMKFRGQWTGNQSVKVSECQSVSPASSVIPAKEGIHSKRITSHEPRVTILITGGFHTENLHELFKKNNISYISIMPKFENEKGYESPYFNLLAGGASDIQHMAGSVIAKNSMIAIASMLCPGSNAVIKNEFALSAEDGNQAFRAAVIIVQKIVEEGMLNGKVASITAENIATKDFGYRRQLVIKFEGHETDDLFLKEEDKNLITIDLEELKIKGIILRSGMETAGLAEENENPIVMTDEKQKQIMRDAGKIIAKSSLEYKQRISEGDDRVIWRKSGHYYDAFKFDGEKYAGLIFKRRHYGQFDEFTYGREIERVREVMKVAKYKRVMVNGFELISIEGVAPFRYFEDMIIMQEADPILSQEEGKEAVRKIDSILEKQGIYWGNPELEDMGYITRTIAGKKIREPVVIDTGELKLSAEGNNILAKMEKTEDDDPAIHWKENFLAALIASLPLYIGISAIPLLAQHFMGMASIVLWLQCLYAYRFRRMCGLDKAAAPKETFSQLIDKYGDIMGPVFYGHELVHKVTGPLELNEWGKLGKFLDEAVAYTLGYIAGPVVAFFALGHYVVRNISYHILPKMISRDLNGRGLKSVHRLLAGFLSAVYILSFGVIAFHETYNTSNPEDVKIAYYPKKIKSSTNPVIKPKQKPIKEWKGFNETRMLKLDEEKEPPIELSPMIIEKLKKQLLMDAGLYRDKGATKDEKDRVIKRTYPGGAFHTYEYFPNTDQVQFERFVDPKFGTNDTVENDKYGNPLKVTSVNEEGEVYKIVDIVPEGAIHSHYKTAPETGKRYLESKDFYDRDGPYKSITYNSDGTEFSTSVFGNLSDGSVWERVDYSDGASKYTEYDPGTPLTRLVQTEDFDGNITQTPIYDKNKNLLEQRDQYDRVVVKKNSDEDRITSYEYYGVSDQPRTITKSWGGSIYEGGRYEMVEMTENGDVISVRKGDIDKDTKTINISSDAQMVIDFFPGTNYVKSKNIYNPDGNLLFNQNFSGEDMMREDGTHHPLYYEEPEESDTEPEDKSDEYNSDTETPPFMKNEEGKESALTVDQKVTPDYSEIFGKLAAFEPDEQGKRVEVVADPESLPEYIKPFITGTPRSIYQEDIDHLRAETDIAISYDEKGRITYIYMPGEKLADGTFSSPTYVKYESDEEKPDDLDKVDEVFADGSEDYFEISKKGGAWSGNPAYMRWVAWWVEPVISYGTGYIAKAGLDHVIGGFWPGIVAVTVAGLVFWLPHRVRGKEVLWSRNVAGLTLGTFAAGIPLYTTGLLSPLALVSLAVLTVFHVLVNIRSLDKETRNADQTEQEEALAWVVENVNGLEHDYMRTALKPEKVGFSGDHKTHENELRKELEQILENIKLHTKKLNPEGALYKAYQSYKKHLAGLHRDINDIYTVYDGIIWLQRSRERYEEKHGFTDNIWKEWEKDRSGRLGNITPIVKLHKELTGLRRELEEKEGQLEIITVNLDDLEARMKKLEEEGGGNPESLKTLYEFNMAINRRLQRAIGNGWHEYDEKEKELKLNLTGCLIDLVAGAKKHFEKDLYSSMFSAIKPEKKREKMVTAALFNSHVLTAGERKSVWRMRAARSLYKEMRRLNSLSLAEYTQREDGLNKFWGIWKAFDFTDVLKGDEAAQKMMGSIVGEDCLIVKDSITRKGEPGNGMTGGEIAAEKTKKRTTIRALAIVALVIVCVITGAFYYLTRDTRSGKSFAPAGDVHVTQPAGDAEKQRPPPEAAQKKVLKAGLKDAIKSGMKIDPEGIKQSSKIIQKNLKKIEELKNQEQTVQKTIETTVQKIEEQKKKIKENISTPELDAMSEDLDKRAEEREDTLSKPGENIFQEERENLFLPEKWNNVPLEETLNITGNLQGQCKLENVLEEQRPISVEPVAESVGHGSGNGYLGSWVAEALDENGRPFTQYLTERGFPRIDPIKGKVTTAEPEWERLIPGEDETATGWITMSANTGWNKTGDAVLVLMDPGKMIVNVQVGIENHTSSAEIYYDTVNRIWYLKFDKDPEYFRVGVREAMEGELGDFRPTKVEETEGSDWRESLPGDVRKMLIYAKSKSLDEKEKVKRGILNLFYYSTNPALERLSREEPDFLKFAFKYLTLDCDGLAMLDAILSYELDIPVFYQAGIFDPDLDGRFYSGQRHAFLITPHGIEEATSFEGKASSLFGKRATKEDWKKEEEYILSRAGHVTNGIKDKEYLMELEGKEEKLKQKMERLRQERKRFEEENPRIGTFKFDETAYYEELTEHYKIKLRQLGYDLYKLLEYSGEDKREVIERNVEPLLDEFRNFEFSEENVKDKYQLMAAGHYIFEALREIEKEMKLYHCNSSHDADIVPTKDRIYAKAKKYAESKNWELWEPLAGHPPGLLYRARRNGLLNEDLTIREKTGLFRTDEQIQVDATTTTSTKITELKIVTDSFTGETFDISPNAAIIDHRCGILWIRDFEEDGRRKYDSLLGTNAGKYNGEQYTAIEQFLTVYNGRWLAVVRMPDGRKRIIGPLTEMKEGKDNVKTKLWSDIESVFVRPDGSWVAVASGGPYMKSYVGKWKGKSFSYENVSVEDKELTVLPPIFFKDKWVGICHPHSKSRVLFGPGKDDIEKIVGDRPIIDWKNMPGDNFIILVDNGNGTMSAVGPGAIKFRQVMYKRDRTHRIKDVYPKGLLVLEARSREGNPYVEFYGPAAMEAGIYDHDEYSSCGEPKFTSDGKWIIFVVHQDGASEFVGTLVNDPRVKGKRFFKIHKRRSSLGEEDVVIINDKEWAAAVVKRPPAVLMGEKEKWDVVGSGGIMNSWEALFSGQPDPYDPQITLKEKIYSQLSKRLSLLAGQRFLPHIMSDGEIYLQFYNWVSLRSPEGPRSADNSITLSNKSGETAGWVVEDTELADNLGLTGQIYTHIPNILMDTIKGKGVMYSGNIKGATIRYNGMYSQENEYIPKPVHIVYVGDDFITPNKTHYSGKVYKNWLSRVVGVYGIGSIEAKPYVRWNRMDVWWQYMSNLAKIDKEYVVAEVSSFLRYFDKEIGWDTSRNLYTGEIFGPFLSFDIRKVAAFVVNNMELCRDLTPVDLSSLFKMFKGTEYEFLIFEIIKSIDNGSSDMESVSQLIIETIRGCDLTEEEWAEIISRYKDHKVSTYPFPGDLGTIYIFPQDFKEEYHETIDKLNRLILNYSPFLSEIRESEFKDLDDIFRLAKKYNLKIPYKDKDLSYDDLIGTFVFLIDSNGFGTRFFDVQIAPEVFSSPLYRMIRLLRSAPESIKLEYGNLRLWRGLLESNDKQLFLEHYGKYLWKNDMTYLKKWKDINRELTNILGDKVAGETDPEFIWAEFRKEFSHNAIGILFMIGIFSFILSYGADRLRRRDIILKGSAEKVIGKILKKNTWFKGKRADTARALMKELSKPRGKELDHKQRAQLEILRLSLPGKQRVLFDIMCCLAIETPDKVKGLSARMLNLIPLVTVAALFDTPEHKARQAMNKELLDLALSVLVKGVELGKIYDRLREILDKYSIRSLDTVESRGTNINHYDELQKRILMEFNRNMSLRVAPSDRYFPGPNGVSIPRAGQGSEFFEFGEYAPGQRIAWKQSARSDRLVSLIAETDINERGNILINMRTLFDPDYADIWIKDFVKSMVVMFDERRVHGRKTHALNDLIFIMPDGSIESVKIRKGKGHDIKSGGMKKVISEFQKRYETAQACLARGRLYFYSEGQNRRYLQRASESINGGGNIAESIRKNVQAKELRGQDVFCVGIKDKEDASTHDILTQDASLIMNKYKARALFWSRNTAGPFRRKAVKQPTRPVSKKLGKQIIKPDHQKIKGSDERWNPPVHKNQHRTFRFPDYIWQEFKTLLNANAGEDVYNIVKNRGLSWIDPEGNRHWIDELDGLDAGTLKVIWTAAKNAVNIANGKNPQDNGYVKDTQAIKDVIAYHEDIHALFRDQKYKELISHFRQKLEEKLGPLHESHPFIKAFSKTYGRPHAGEFPEGESRVTSNERRIDWYLEEFLTLSIQEHNLFHDKYFVLNKMIEMADKKDKTVLSRNKDIIRNALDAILEDHLIKYEIEKRQEPPSYLQYGHEYETRRGLDDLQKLYPGLENILGDLPEGADVLVIGPGAGFEILDMKKDYSHLNFQSIDRENIFELEGIRIDIQNRYSISDDAEAEEKLDYLKRHFLEHDVEKGLVGKGLYEENMFDAVIVGSWVMKHIKNKPALIEEIHKVLKVGGVGLTELIDMQIAAKNNLLGVKPPKTLMEQAEKLKQVIRFFNKPEISRGELRAEARLFGHSRDTNIVDLASLTIKKTSTRKLSIPLRLHDPENGIYVVDRRGGSSVSSAEKTDPFIKHKKEILDKRGTLDAEKHLKLYGPESNSILDKEGRKDLLERLKKYSRILGQHIFLSEETHAEGMQYISVEKGRPGTYRFILNRIPSGLKKNARFCVPGYSYDLRVKGVQGTVLMLEDAIGDSVPFPRSGELVFRGEDTTYFAQKEVVDELIRNLSSNGSDTTGYKAIDRLLRLSRDDVPTSSEKLREKIDYLDKEISRIKIITEEGEEIWKGDESQDMAVRLALSGSRQTVIHGSPGTGKTKTIVAIIRQYVRRGKKVLLVSQQNQAVDQALARVMDHVPSLRLSNEAKEEMKKYGTDRIWSGNTVARNRFERDIRGNNTGYLIASTNISLVTDKFYGKNNLKGRDFDVVIMDESSRTQLTEALVPMRYLKSDGKLIVVGDAKQLKPHRDMDIEKRFRMNGKTGVTKKDLDGFYGSVLDEMEGTGIADEVMLSTNWRSRPLLAKLVSEVFYNSEVNLRGWEEFTPATLNLKLIDTDWDKKLVFEESGNEFGRNGTSLMNRRSATMVTNMVKTYMEKPETKAEDITIITFYEAQKVMIETLLENLYPDGKRTRVFTVDSYQGGENKTIIIDFVRSNLKGKIGFMRDMNRLRVAMSRAEEHLGLVMDSRVFMEDPETIDEEDKEVRDALKKINEFYEREVLSVFPDAEFRKYKTNGNGSEELEEEDQEVPDDMEDAIEEDDIETSVPSDLIAGRYKVLGEIEYVNGKIVFLAEDTKKDVKIFIELPARKAENGEFKKGSLISEIHNITKDILDVIPKGNRFLLEPNEYGILKIIRGDILAVVDPSAGEEKGKKTNPKKKKAVGGKEIGIKFGDKRRVREEWARGKNKGFMGKFEEVKDESGIVIKPVVISGDNGKLEGIVRNLDTGVEFDLAEMEQEVISGSEDVRRYSEEKAARIKELLEDVMPVDSEKRFIEEILDNFLCNNLPDNIILTKGGVQGFFGIAIEGHAGSHFDIKRRKVLAIDTDLADKNPISFLHEVMEYFKYIAQEDEYEGYITAIYKLLEDVDLLKSAEVNKFSGRTWFEAHEFKYRTQGRRDYFSENRAHYLIRAFTRQVFKEHDFELTQVITATGMYETAQELVPAVVKMMRKAPIYAIEPAASLESVSPVIDYLRQTERSLDKGGHNIHARSYLADEGWVWNIRQELGKVIPDFYTDVTSFEGKNRDENKTRMVIRLKSSDEKDPVCEEAVIRTFIIARLIECISKDNKDLSDEEKENIAEEIINKKVRFIAAYFGNTERLNTVIDLFTDITVVECDRYGRDSHGNFKKDGYSEEVPEHLAERLLCLLRSSITNYDEIIRKAGGEDIPEILKALFSGSVMRIRSVDWGTIADWKRSWDAVLKSL